MDQEKRAIRIAARLIIGGNVWDSYYVKCASLVTGIDVRPIRAGIKRMLPAQWESLANGLGGLSVDDLPREHKHAYQREFDKRLKRERR